VGKYVGYEDSYKSLNEALYHGGFPHRVKVNIKWIEAEALEAPSGAQLLEGADGILVPGGFGDRGTRGMMQAARHARERRVPYFGICYGFQWAAVEYARNVAGLIEADSTECNPEASAKVIYKLRDLLGIDELGGTMRLGAYACALAPGSLAQRVYATSLVHERHRHRYEFNCLYEPTLTEHGLRISDVRRMASSWRSPSCRNIRGTSLSSSTRNSSPSRRNHIRSLRPLSKPRMSTR
jgi:CTP synthase